MKGRLKSEKKLTFFPIFKGKCTFSFLSSQLLSQLLSQLMLQHTIQEFEERFPKAIQFGWALVQDYPRCEDEAPSLLSLSKFSSYTIRSPVWFRCYNFDVKNAMILNWMGLSICVPDYFWNDDLLENRSVGVAPVDSTESAHSTIPIAVIATIVPTVPCDWGYNTEQWIDSEDEYAGDDSDEVKLSDEATVAVQLSDEVKLSDEVRLENMLTEIESLPDVPVFERKASISELLYSQEDPYNTLDMPVLARDPLDMPVLARNPSDPHKKPVLARDPPSALLPLPDLPTSARELPKPRKIKANDASTTHKPYVHKPGARILPDFMFPGQVNPGKTPSPSSKTPSPSTPQDLRSQVMTENRITYLKQIAKEIGVSGYSKFTSADIETLRQLILQKA